MTKGDDIMWEDITNYFLIFSNHFSCFIFHEIIVRKWCIRKWEEEKTLFNKYYHTTSLFPIFSIRFLLSDQLLSEWYKTIILQTLIKNTFNFLFFIQIPSMSKNCCNNLMRMIFYLKKKNEARNVAPDDECQSVWTC